METYLKIENPNDKLGGGMFSKMGKYTQEKFMVFQKKNEILFG